MRGLRPILGARLYPVRAKPVSVVLAALKSFRLVATRITRTPTATACSQWLTARRTANMIPFKWLCGDDPPWSEANLDELIGREEEVLWELEVEDLLNLAGCEADHVTLWAWFCTAIFASVEDEPQMFHFDYREGWRPCAVPLVHCHGTA